MYNNGVAYGLIAQLVEQLTLNQLVVGSSPTEPRLCLKIEKLIKACKINSFTGLFFRKKNYKILIFVKIFVILLSHEFDSPQDVFHAMVF